MAKDIKVYQAASDSFGRCDRVSVRMIEVRDRYRIEAVSDLIRICT